MHVQYSADERRFVYKGLQYRMMERHDRCGCECLVKAADCRPGQIYREDECRCVCSPDDRLQCLNQQKQQLEIVPDNNNDHDDKMKLVQYPILSLYKPVRSNAGRLFVWNETECKCHCKYMPLGVIVASNQCFISRKKSLSSSLFSSSSSSNTATTSVPSTSTSSSSTTTSLLLLSSKKIGAPLLMNSKVVTLEQWNKNNKIDTKIVTETGNFTEHWSMPSGDCCQQSNGQMMMARFDFNLSKNDYFYCR